MQQAEDYRAEVQALANLLEPLSDDDFNIRTQFRDWTINDVIGHLYMFDVAALKTLQGEGEFAAFFAPIQAQLAKGASLRDAQTPWLNGLAGRALFDRWRENAQAVADAYAQADPKQRVKWAGPDMSALSSITARQMETWAHGQEVFDILGEERIETDRIRNIAHLGVATFGWSFANRGLDIPEPAPHVVLTAPSGATWEWNDVQPDNRVQGSAVDFARVVTQVRSIDDTKLGLTGAIAGKWMAIAQCFAGPPADPPAPGTRGPG